MFLDALSYPFRRGGWVVLLLGAIFAGLLDLFSHAPLVGFVVGIFSAGYFGAYFLSIVGTTMNGRDETPPWPGFDSFFDDILSPYFRLIVLFLVSFGPAFVLMAYFDDAEEIIPLLIVLAALIFGIFYFPLAVLATSAYGGLTALSPHIVLPAMFRCMPGYLLYMVEITVPFVLVVIAGDLLTKIPFAGWILTTVLGLYNLMFQARLIGLIYRQKHAVLDWD